LLAGLALALPACTLSLDFGAGVLLPALDGGGPDAVLGTDSSTGDAPTDIGPGDVVCRDGCVCATGRGDCDGLALNGCETDLAVTDAHCGSCGVGCSGAQRCMSGVCRVVKCRAPMVACGMQCADVLSDPRHCGACGASCGSGTPRCCNGSCAMRCP
jgi:hypothetical protein